ncbi:ribonuclease Z [Lapidilactobacillus luobeiensis]|uniref:ribonuclease Z n=1 Tax=Lapidilactobacillus luobeiensis TaxID=2950371 RepID=UPI0021C40416|nr:ribonuclease Z [Lapidilactobacillus luobeiensis]
MELEFLGTGAGVPARGRNVSSLVLKMLDERNEIWMFDCGEGTQQQILQTGIRPRKVTKIFISHLHGDHIYGLPGFLSSRSNQGGTAAVDLYGPVGLKQYVQTSLKTTGTRLAYPLNFHEVTTTGVIFADGQTTVSTLPLDHRITCLGYRVVEADLPGELLVEKLRDLQVPSGPIYGKLKAGQEVTLADGRVLAGKDFVGPAKRGRIVTVISDTRQTPNILKLAADADVLVHESTFGQAEGRLAHQYFHSTSTQAAKVAQKAHCRQLLLTHISARYLGRGAHQLQTEAQHIFKQTRVVNDFDIVAVPFAN